MGRYPVSWRREVCAIPGTDIVDRSRYAFVGMSDASCLLMRDDEKRVNTSKKRKEGREKNKAIKTV